MRSKNNNRARALAFASVCVAPTTLTPRFVESIYRNIIVGVHHVGEEGINWIGLEEEDKTHFLSIHVANG